MRASALFYLGTAFKKKGLVMTGGQGGGIISNASTGVSSAATTIAGAAVLPSTGHNTLLTILTLATIVGGGLVLASFVVTRLVSRFYR